MSNGNGTGSPMGEALVTLEARPERRLIRPTGSRRHVDFVVRVSRVPDQGLHRDSARTPLTLSVVVDRSGSMAGEKLATAKRATLALLERLDERDRFALVVYDDQIDVLQPAARVTPELKRRVASALSEVEARSTTALHLGWLTGCRAIAGDVLPEAGSLARCFLLTDGLANVGETDPERIASEAAGIRREAGIGTSTFGIGDDYDEGLLAPMAVAGGGQFHHLRSAGEIGSTFIGELGGLLAVATPGVRVELELPRGVEAETISAYWLEPDDAATRLSLGIGDLIAGDERHVVVRLRFPRQDRHAEPTLAVRARLAWLAHGVEQRSAWQPIEFSYASQDACSAEQADLAVMHWVGLHHADRAQRAAADLNRRGDLAGARTLLDRVAARIGTYAGSDAELRDAIVELQSMRQQVASAPMASAQLKEVYYATQRRSRAQPDLRGPRS